MKFKQRLYGRIIIDGIDGEVYKIEMIEDEGYKGGIVFNVTSNTGIDHYGNGGGFDSIEKALKCVNNSIKVTIEDKKYQ